MAKFLPRIAGYRAEESALDFEMVNEVPGELGAPLTTTSNTNKDSAVYASMTELGSQLTLVPTRDSQSNAVKRGTSGRESARTRESISSIDSLEVLETSPVSSLVTLFGPTEPGKCVHAGMVSPMNTDSSGEQRFWVQVCYRFTKFCPNVQTPKLHPRVLEPRNYVHHLVRSVRHENGATLKASDPRSHTLTILII